MKPLRIAAALAVCLLADGCAFIPKTYPRLEEARRQQDAALSEPLLELAAPAALGAARDAFERARAARDTLDDPAVVEHLTYIARQKLAIARATADLRAAEQR